MTSIIFQNIIEKISDTSKNINGYFDNIDYYNTNIYDILKKLPKYNVVFYVLIVFLIFNFVSRFNVRLNEILTFMICIVVLYLYRLFRE